MCSHFVQSSALYSHASSHFHQLPCEMQLIELVILYGICLKGILAQLAACNKDNELIGVENTDICYFFHRGEDSYAIDDLDRMCKQLSPVNHGGGMLYPRDGKDVDDTMTFAYDKWHIWADPMCKYPVPKSFPFPFRFYTDPQGEPAIVVDKYTATDYSKFGINDEDYKSVFNCPAQGCKNNTRVWAWPNSKFTVLDPPNWRDHKFNCFPCMYNRTEQEYTTTQTTTAIPMKPETSEAQSDIPEDVDTPPPDTQEPAEEHSPMTDYEAFLAAEEWRKYAYVISVMVILTLLTIWVMLDHFAIV